MKNNLKLEILKRKQEDEIHNLKLAFFTNISHDLRTPLTLILGTIKRIINTETSKINLKNSLDVIENSANSLLRLANELLDYRKIETGNLKHFGNSALEFEAYFWTQLKPGGDMRRLRSEIRFRIDELFRENDITIAFPQRDVHLDGVLKLESTDYEVDRATPNFPIEN